MDRDREVPLYIWVFHFTWITAVIISIAAYLLASNPNKYLYIQTVILALTLIAVVWYVVLTYRMQRAVTEQLAVSIRQVNLSILPAFVAHVGKNRAEDENRRPVDFLELENVGNGIALNVTIDTLHVTLGGDTPFDQEGLDELLPDPHIIFDAVMIIAAKEAEMVTHRSYVSRETGESSPTKFDWMNRLTPARATTDHDLKVRFMDVLGNRYVQTIHVGASGSWPDVVELDGSKQKYGHPTIALVSPFTQGPLKFITTKERRETWRRL